MLTEFYSLNNFGNTQKTKRIDVFIEFTNYIKYIYPGDNIILSTLFILLQYEEYFQAH